MSTLCSAQSGTNSPYSQYGLGLLSEQSTGFNRGMNGLSQGFREPNQVNHMNPASYSAVDSLTFLFDVGVSGQLTNFKEGKHRVNAKNADFEYAVIALRLFKHLGLSAGLIPYTNVGYNYSLTDYIGSSKTDTYTNTYSGSGGLHQVYFGAGWEPFRGFSFGANISYLWGNIKRNVVNSYSDANFNTLSKSYTAEVRNYKLDVGLQYTARLTKNDALTIGATYGLGHKIGGKPVCQIISTNSQTLVADTTTYPKEGDLHLTIPMSISAGFVYNHNDQLKVGADYSLQKWGEVEYPDYDETASENNYQLKKGLFKDRHKFTVGGEYCPGAYSRKFLERVRYRAGVSYATPYLKINGVDGPKEISASIGFGIPIINKWNNRSILNISAQWAQQKATALITENTFRINIGITFNEAWFMKWKVE